MAVKLESARSIQPQNTCIYIFGDDADHSTGRQTVFKSHSDFDCDCEGKPKIDPAQAKKA